MKIVLNVTPSGCDCSFDPLLADLVAWYRNNGTDYSLAGNSLTPSGTGPSLPTLATGLGGVDQAAAGLNGAIDCFWFRKSPLVVNGPSSWQCWFHQDGGTTPRGLWGQSWSNHQCMSINGVSSLYGKMQPGPGGTVASYTPGAWNHAVMTNDGARSLLYVNGVLMSNVAEVPNFSFNPAEGFTYGEDSGNNFDGGIQGRMQYMAVWGRVLTSAEVLKLYNGGAGFDPTL